MVTIKQLNNDLAAMEKQGHIKKSGYKYNRDGDPELRYELTQAGDEKFWAYELEYLSDADKTNYLTTTRTRNTLLSKSGSIPFVDTLTVEYLYVREN
jgi:hypothetical protein